MCDAAFGLLLSAVISAGVAHAIAATTIQQPLKLLWLLTLLQLIL